MKKWIVYCLGSLLIHTFASESGAQATPISEDAPTTDDRGNDVPERETAASSEASPTQASRETVSTDAPLDSPQNAPADPPQACVPSCRSGYYCHLGECRSRCNPVCPTEMMCTDLGECVYSPATATAKQLEAAKRQEDERTAHYAAREQRRREVLAQRARFKEHLISVPRIPLNLDWRVDVSDEIAISSLVFSSGLHRNLVPVLAVHARAGVGVGYAKKWLFDTDDTVFAGSANGAISMMFGPFRRFYVGPVFWVTHHWFAPAYKDRYDDHYYDDYLRSSDVGQSKVLRFGSGVDFSMILGDDAKYGLNWSIKSVMYTNFDGNYNDISLAFEIGLSRYIGLNP